MPFINKVNEKLLKLTKTSEDLQECACNNRLVSKHCESGLRSHIGVKVFECYDFSADLLIIFPIIVMQAY